MKEYILTDKDYATIKDSAHQLWIHDAIRHDYFNCQCYVKATLMFINSRKLTMIDGKLYEQEKPKST